LKAKEVCCGHTFANPPGIRKQALVISLNIKSEEYGKVFNNNHEAFIFISYQQEPNPSR